MSLPVDPHAPAATIAGRVLSERTALAHQVTRSKNVIIGILLFVVAGLGTLYGISVNGGTGKNDTIKALSSQVVNLTKTNTSQQGKITEQSTVETQLREDVNKLSTQDANTQLICAIYNLSPQLQKLPAFVKFCTTTKGSHATTTTTTTTLPAG